MGVPTIRIALAQMNAVVGGLTQNAEALRLLRSQAGEAGADLVLTPELSLIGYPPEDLLLKEGFIESAREALTGIAADVDLPPMLVGTIVGEGPGVALAPSGDGRDVGRVEASGPTREHIANALVVVDGSVVAVAAKRLLPNYDVFDEVRYFHPGTGTIINVGGVAVGLLICEDVWTDNGPALELANQGATLLVVANASPFARGRRGAREAMLCKRALETGCAVAYVNMVGGQDELVFDGQSVVVNSSGEVIARAGAFSEELLVCDIEARGSSVGTPVGGGERASVKDAGLNQIAEPLGEVEEIYQALVVGARDYLRKNGFQSAVIGLSGGVDSSLVATIAVDALGSKAVRGLAMPSRYSSESSVNDAVEMALLLDIELTVLPIEPAHVALGGVLSEAIEGGPVGITDENLQSRIRGVLLMGVSNATGAIVLTTGNKSEMAVGYTTLYGDSVGGFAVIKDVPKTLVYELCRYRNEVATRAGTLEPIPLSVLEKPPSAELRPDQRDDQSLPPYDVLDPLLELYVEGDATAEEVVVLGYDPELVGRITRLVGQSEYKRRQMAPGVRISGKAFGRDRRMPISNAYRPKL
jgi:NAD+ synthase (glutamine-hydrolysing)